MRAARFERPDWVPVSFGFNPSCWEHYPKGALDELRVEHSWLFPESEASAEGTKPQYAPWQRAGERYTDSWGCEWETSVNGMTGAVVRHPLADWSELEDCQPPSPDEHFGWGPIDWPAVRQAIARRRASGQLAEGHLRHGHTFLTLTYLRGYENLIFDMADGAPELQRLIEMVEDFNRGLVERFLDAGVEWMGYPEDLGMQRGPMLSPEHFRQYIKPVYQRLMQPARDAGCVVHMHSDGDIRVLCDDLVQLGIDVINLQDLVNGVDWIAENLKGRVCIDLDIDRQKITRFGTPVSIDEHIHKIVDQLSSPEGGLMLRYDLNAGVPLKNVRALMDALERYARR